MAVSSYKAKQMIVMRRDLKMRKGKIAAQAGHACVEATLMALAREGRLDEVRVLRDEDGAPSWVALDHPESDEAKAEAKQRVAALCAKYPLYAGM